jgi:hypothetical protein
MPQEPQIIDLDAPENAPRTLAIILLVCGVLGVAFMVINTVFTGDDQYYIQDEWDRGNEPVNNRFDILPNLVRGRPNKSGDETDEDEEAEKPKVVQQLKEDKRGTKRPTGTTTAPSSIFGPKTPPATGGPAPSAPK